MAKLTAPLLSMDASGSVGSTLTFAKWKGRNYVRQLVTPSNPRSAGQTGNRSMMKFLGQAWAPLSDLIKASWLPLADQGKYSTFNGFVSDNMNRWTQFTTPYQEYPLTPGAAYQMTSLAAVCTGGVRQALIEISGTDDTNLSWGAIIYRSASAIVTPTKDMVVGVVPTSGGGVWTAQFVDTPLEPGTYHYRVVSFSVDGQLGDITTADDPTVVT